MLLNKVELELAELCDDKNTRSALAGIYITEEGSIVSDGYLLVKTKVVRLPDEDFPKLEGFSSAISIGDSQVSAETVEKLQPFILPKKEAIEIAKALPKKAQVKALEMVKIDTVYTNSNGSAKLGVINDGTVKVFTPKKIEAEYPSFDEVISETEQKEPKVKLRINASLLEKICRYIAKTNTDDKYTSVEISVYSDMEPVRFCWKGRDTEFYGILMPIRS